jgi:hypothetical protein
MIDITKAKVKDRVRDRWFPEWGIGEVTRIISSNRIEIEFTGLEGQMIYDRSHCQFLEPCPSKQHITVSRELSHCISKIAKSR